jgi:outer membrane protein TolC
VNLLVALLVLSQVQTEAPGQALSETQAVELALKNSPRLRAERDSVDEARALTDVATRWNNPQLRVSGVRYDQTVKPAFTSDPYPLDPLYHTRVALRWAPPELGQRGAREAESKADEARAEVSLVMATRDLVARVRGLHATVLSYDEQLKLGKEVLRQREQLRDLVKSRLALSAATRLDQSLSEVDLLDASTQMTELEAHRRSAYGELLLHLGLPVGTTVTLTPDEADTCADVPDVAQWIERGEKASPRLRVYEADMKAADAERSRRWLALVPWFDFFEVGYAIGGNTTSGYVPGYVSFGFQLTLPLLDWKRADRRALAARHAGLLEQVRADKVEVSQAILRAAALHAEQAALVRRYRDAAAVVEEGLGHIRRALASGEITNLVQVVQVEARLSAAKRSYLRAHLDCKLSRFELDRLVGAGP